MEKNKLIANDRTILKYTGVFGGLQGLSILIGIIRNKLVAIILGPQGVGLISLFNSTVNFMFTCTNLGLPTSSVKTLSETYENNISAQLRHQVSLTRHWTLLAAIGGTIIFFFLSPLLDKITFSWGNHTLHFMLLSPIIFFLTISAGETAVLKSIRRLKDLAVITIINVAFALLFSIPIYYFFGEAGIVPSLLMVALVQLLLTIRITFRLFPPIYRFDVSILKQGKDIIRLGIAFVFAGIFTNGADFAIRSFLNKTASLWELGLYNAGFMLTTIYVGMLFSVLESDYYPRLSAVNKDKTKCNKIINQQAEITFLLAAPMLVVLMTCLPIVIPLLYSSAFLPVIGMAQVVIIALFIRSVKLPVAYLTLAKGDSISFLLLEAYCALLQVVSVVSGYRLYGLTGIGYGLLFTSIVDFIVIFTFTHKKYGYQPSKQIFYYMAMQLPLGILTFIIAQFCHGIIYWILCAFISLISIFISVRIYFKRQQQTMSFSENLS